MKVEALQEAIRETFNPTLKITPKIQMKRESFLLKLPLFSLIYQKKGELNFQLITTNIRLIKSDFGQIIFKDQTERCFNYILRGTAMMFVKSQGQDKRGQPRFYKRLGEGQHFGQKMQLGKEEIESIRTVSCCYLLQLDMNIFYNAFAGHFKYDQLRDKITFLKEIWIFKTVTRSILERILLSSENNTFKRGHVLFRQGQMAESLWVIMYGEVTLTAKVQGKPHAFCLLAGKQICGIVQLMEETAYEYSAICTSDHTTVLKVQKQIMLEVVCKDIEPETILRQKLLTDQLRNSTMYSQKLLIAQNKEQDEAEVRLKTRKRQLFHRKYKSQMSCEQPIDKMKVLDSLFNRQIQLKEQKIRPIRLSFIKKAQETLYASNRMSFVNGCTTFDKEIILKYMGRKQRQFLKAVKQEKEFQKQKVALVPELKIQRSSAVKNHKRKLKNSRRNCFSSLSHLDSFND